MEFTDAECRYFLAKGYEAAATSQDPSTQVGAFVLIGNVIQKDTISCNAPSKGFEVTEEDWANRDYKLQFVHHAERSALDAATRNGLWLEGATLVAPWSACTECAKSIVATGIKTLIRHVVNDEAASSTKWTESVAFGDRLMEAAGIRIYNITGPIEGAPKVRKNGTLWDPSE